MLDAFAEGARSMLQACHLVILLPIALAVLAGRARPPVVAGALLGVSIGGWLFATRWLVLTDGRIAWSAPVVVASTVAVALLAGRDHPGTAGPMTMVTATTLAGVIVTAWWRPCVGTELGEILTRAPAAPWGQLAPAVGFMLGISLPLIVVALGVAAWRPGDRGGGRLSAAATLAGVLIALPVLFGRHGEIVARLVEWSTPVGA